MNAALRSCGFLMVLLRVAVAACAAQQPAAGVELFVHDPASVRQPNPLCNQEMCAALLHEIDSAERSIDFAIYGLGGQDAIFEALKRSKARGVRVRGIVDSDVMGDNYYRDTPELISSIGSVRTDRAVDVRSARDQLAGTRGSEACDRPQGTAGPVSCFRVTVGGRTYQAAQASEAAIEFSGDIMHNKFFVIDERAVWTGSANISDTDIGGYNANVGVLIRHPIVASWYTHEFEQMYERGLFHTQKTSSAAAPVSIDDATVRVLFSPQDDAVRDGIIPLIRNARDRINVSVFYLTNREVTEELIRSAQRGIRIRIIIDASGASNEYSKHELLRSGGIQLKVENWGGKMHAKAASFDGHSLVVGSMNWTSAGDQRNDENILIFQDATRMVTVYDRTFDTLWQSIPDLWLNAQPRPEGVESGTACGDGIDDDFDQLVDLKDPDCREVAGAAPFPDGSCPSVAPIKGNASSRIFHVPSGRFYTRTRAELCFTGEEEALAAGYRRSGL